MVKDNFTKIMEVHFVNGDFKRTLEECSDKELHDLYYALNDEILRRAALGTELEREEEADEEVALDAMYD